jgi:putative membrane protein
MIHAESFVAAGLLLAAWTAAWYRRRQRPPAGLALPFAAGLLIGLGAVNGPLHDLAERALFSAHMIQHLLLMLVVPPLLLAGTPGWMVDALLGRLLRPRVVQRVARAVTRPAPALGLYAAALVVWHLPGPFNRALAAPGWHAVEHLVLVATAALAWWPVLSPSRLLPPLHYGAQILYLFVFGMPMTVVAAMIAGAEQTLYPFYAEAARTVGVDALADQRLGGILMWVPSGVVPLAAFTVVFFRWAAAEADDTSQGSDFPP